MKVPPRKLPPRSFVARSNIPTTAQGKTAAARAMALANQDFAFDASPENLRRVVQLLNLVGAKSEKLQPEKSAFFACVGAVCQLGMSVPEACRAYMVPRTVLVRILRQIPTQTPEHIFRAVLKASVSTLTTGIRGKQNRYIVPGVQLGLRGPAQSVSQTRVHAAATSSVERNNNRPPAFDVAASTYFDMGVSQSPPLDLQTNMSPELAALLPFDIYADMAGGSATLSHLPVGALNASDLSFSQAAVPVRHDTPFAEDVYQANSLAGYPAVQSNFAMPPGVDLNKSDAVQPGFAGASNMSEAELQQSSPPDTTQVQNYIRTHPGEGWVIEVSPNMMAAAHEEFQSLADSFGHLVNEHKFPILYAMLDVCNGLTIQQAAKISVVDPQILLGMMHALHASSPMDVLLWLNEPPTDHRLVPPGFYTLVTTQQAQIPAPVASLAAQRFVPHAQMYHQHPLNAAPHPLWEANHLGAQVMPRW